MIFGLPGRHPTLSAYSPLDDSYAGKAVLGLADTGQGWWLMENAAEARLSVIGGKLTNAAATAAVRAGYVTTDLGANVLHTGAQFTLGPTTNPGGGGVALVIWKTLLRAVASIPDSPLHLVVTDTNWSLGYWEAGTLTALDGHDFGAPLATDGATVHEVSVAIAGTTATITLPDASVVEVTDAHIGSLAGRFACFEVYQGDASTDSKAAFTRVWAAT